MSKINERLEKINQIQDIESRLDVLKKQRAAIRSRCFRSGTLSLTIQTSDFHNKGVEDAIEFDQHFMVEYLTSEIEHLEAKSDRLLLELTPQR